MKPGLSLIEVVIGIALAAIMTILLYQSFAQTRRMVGRVDGIVNYNSDLALVYNQLDKDITGICLIATSTAQKTPTPLASENILSFITTNALAVYDKQAVRPVRVFYRLQKTTADLFSLVRQEGSWQLDPKAFDDTKKIPAYEIITGLKKFSVKLFVPKDEQGKEWLTFTKWSEEEQKSAKRSLPSFIDIEGSWWDAENNREHPFSFSFFVPFEEEKKKQDTMTTPTTTPTARKREIPAQPGLRS